MRKQRILIADDHSLMAEGIARIVSADFDVVGIVFDGRQVVASAEALRPDIVSLDIGMPILNGLQAAVEIKRLLPRAKIVFVTQQLILSYLRAAFRAGASAYVSKQSAGTELLRALKAVMAGGTYITPLLAGQGEHNPDDLKADPAKVFSDALSPRQREVLQLIAEGRTAKEISSILNISARTVEFHRGAVMDELGLRTTAELTQYAVAHHILAPPPVL